LDFFKKIEGKEGDLESLTIPDTYETLQCSFSGLIKNSGTIKGNGFLTVPKAFCCFNGNKNSKRGLGAKFPNATLIDDYAFYGSYMALYSDFSSVTTIGAYSFANCEFSTYYGG
jgi:hypothetical protein